MAPILEIRSLSVALGGNEILRDLSLTLPAGKILTLLGPSGSGKSTLLAAIAGLVPVRAGEIRLFGRLLSAPGFLVPPEERGIGMVFQSFALWPHMTVEDHVAFPLIERCRKRRRTLIWGRGGRSARGREAELDSDDGCSLEDVRKLVDRLLVLTEMSAFRKLYPAELSGGQKQRVALARGLAASRGLLLMDEPFSSLDAPLRSAMRREFIRLHRATGSAVVFVTHEREEALALGDHVAVLVSGRLEQIGTPEDIYGRPATPFIARFVTDAALVRGRWEGDRFFPFGSVGNTPEWSGNHVPKPFRAQGIFPVRPEEWDVRTEPPGIPARVIGRSFEGRGVRFFCEPIEKGGNPIQRSGECEIEVFYPLIDERELRFTTEAQIFLNHQKNCTGEKSSFGEHGTGI